MKKGLIFAAIISATLASCSNDEVLEINEARNEISFRADLGTRAVETTSSAMDIISVSSFLNGALYFDNVPFAKSGSSFVCNQGEYFWPKSEKLDFYAYYPSAASMGATFENQKIKSIKINKKCSEQFDFVTAKAIGVEETAGVSINLQFEHSLSKIEIVGKTDNPAYKYEIMGVRIGNVYGKGTFNMTAKGTAEDPKWTPVGASNEDYTITYGNPIELTSESGRKSLMGKSESAMIIPQTLKPWSREEYGQSYVAALVKISSNTGCKVFPKTGEYAWVATPLDMTLEPGRSYVLTIDFTTGAGSVADEQSAGDGDCDPDVDIDKLIEIPEDECYEPVFGNAIIYENEIKNWIE